MENNKPIFNEHELYRINRRKNLFTGIAVTMVVLVIVLFVMNIGSPNHPNEPDEIFTASESEVKFPEEKILTISAKEYCDSIGKQLSDYDLVGIHTKNIELGVPEGAEVVVCYRLGYAATNRYTYSWYYGTALIPKEKGE